MSTTAMTLNGESYDLSQDALDSLNAALSGNVLLPDDSEFEESRTVWNGMIDRHPALVVRCRGTADVMACVNFARERNLVLTVKGGGHNIAGLAVSDGGMMLDMSLVRGVWVDPAARVALRRVVCWVMLIAKHRCMDWPRSWGSSPKQASPVSPWAAVLDTSRGSTAGPPTT